MQRKVFTGVRLFAQLIDRKFLDIDPAVGRTGKFVHKLVRSGIAQILRLDLQSFNRDNIRVVFANFIPSFAIGRPFQQALLEIMRAIHRNDDVRNVRHLPQVDAKIRALCGRAEFIGARCRREATVEHGSVIDGETAESTRHRFLSLGQLDSAFQQILDVLDKRHDLFRCGNLAVCSGCALVLRTQVCQRLLRHGNCIRIVEGNQIQIHQALYGIPCSYCNIAHLVQPGAELF